MVQRVEWTVEATEPTAAEWRARCLLATSLVSHRATVEGLSAADVEAVRRALAGRI